MRSLLRAARRHPHADIAIAAVLYAVTLIGTAGVRVGHRLDTAGVLLAALACGALVARRHWPWPVLVVSTVAAEFFLALGDGHASTLVLGAPLIALYTVADTSPGRRALIGCGLVVLVLAGAHMVLGPASFMGAENLALAALGGLAVAAGEASRHRRAYLAEVEERARRAESERDLEASRRVTEERLRIARDLHDVVGHHLALINVQAGVAAHVLDSQPGQVRQSLAHIRQASRGALEELRDTVGLLREPGEPVAPTDPTPGLAGLAGLVASFRRSGLEVTEEVGGTPRPLPSAADVTAYRVVQESLTNVCKHAARRQARLRLEYRPRGLRIVVDSGAPAVPSRSPGSMEGSGHGIVGMRERVAAVGGSLDAGSRGDGGYRVSAVLPLPSRGTE